ncbi:HIT domain-containing protein [Alteromonas sp. CYL-A6]|uniref:HIT domain-containing protein n=1 Tax=Alteromonas nitratireducens TaxID=3390813 RepID=UPI0034C21DF0
MFKLDERLQGDTLKVADLPLCRVLLMNDSQFPWLILVPRRDNVIEFTELSETDQQQLWQESLHVSRVMQQVFGPDKMNVAALGNVVSQLHVHHVARYKNDVAWPHPVWGRQPAIPYSEQDATTRCSQLAALLQPDEKKELP